MAVLSSPLLLLLVVAAVVVTTDASAQAVTIEDPEAPATVGSSPSSTDTRLLSEMEQLRNELGQWKEVFESLLVDALSFPANFSIIERGVHMIQEEVSQMKQEMNSRFDRLDGGVQNLTRRTDVLLSDRNPLRLRLVGSSRNSGRVEVFHDGRWGTVCDDRFSESEAATVCRQLGLPSENAEVFARHGGGSGRIWLDEVQCPGHPSSLDKCEHGGWGNSDCDHDEDVGVGCH